MKIKKCYCGSKVVGIIFPSGYLALYCSNDKCETMFTGRNKSTTIKGWNKKVSVMEGEK